MGGVGSTVRRISEKIGLSLWWKTVEVGLMDSGSDDDVKDELTRVG